MFNLDKRLADRNLSWEAVSEKTGISIVRLRGLSRTSDLSLGELRKLCSVLRVPLEELSDRQSSQKVRMLFRENGAKPDSDLDFHVDALSRQIEDLSSIASDLPLNNSWLDIFSTLSPNEQSAEEYARVFRDRFFHGDQLSPILSLPQIAAEVMGIYMVFSKDVDAEGASAIVDGRAYIFLSPRKFQPRMLFTLAHEIGHLIGRHHEKDQEFATLDLARDFNGWDSSKKLEEQFANAFASALLLPLQAVVEAVKNIRKLHNLRGPLGDIEINFLARFFGVSFEVAGRRCEALGLLPKHGARALYEIVVQSHKNPERRAEEAGLPPREILEFSISSELVLAALRKVRNGTVSIGRAAEILRMPIRQLAAANTEREV